MRTRIATVLVVLAFFMPAFAYAALININTADATLLDTLPGIGPSKAAAIITYRTQHGSFAKIEDIQNVSGIGPSTYADIKSLITVGDVPIPPPPPSSSSSATSTNSTNATTTTTTSSSGGGPAEYLLIPMLRIIAGGDRTVSSGADTAFTAVVYDGKSNKRDDATVTWSFGDGMRKTGASVFHQYYSPGEYLAVVHASTSDGGDALKEIVITVKDASIKIASVSPRGISLVNDSPRTLDLSLWRLSMGGQEFKIPEDTQILAGHTILFPSQVIELPIAESALLLYPSGEIAAVYPPISKKQPSEPVDGLNRVKKVEPIISQQTNVQTHAETVIAPVATTELAAAGATLPAPTAVVSSGFFHSPWTLSFIGMLALAGGAFIFL